MTKIVWLGAFVGSAIGGYIPCLFGADMISMEGIGGSIVGGVVGIFAAYKLGQVLGL
jgi:hypothetical protein